MTPDERNILQPFLQELAQARGAAKDPEAEAMIAQAIRDNPDAAYLLVQHALLSDQALHAAQAQIQDLQAQSQGGAGQGGAGQGGAGQGGAGQGGWTQGGGGQGTSVPSFLGGAPPQAPAYGGGGYGGADVAGGGYGSPSYGGQGYGAPGYIQGQARPVQSNPLSANSGLGGFLRSAGTMAAGVAAGDFLAEGLSNLFGGGGGGGW